MATDLTYAPRASHESIIFGSANEFGDRAGEAQQARYYDELAGWARENDTTVFFFEAFDEPWKGDPNNPLGAEKHWGLFNVDRTPKEAMR